MEAISASSTASAANKPQNQTIPGRCGQSLNHQREYRLFFAPKPEMRYVGVEPCVTEAPWAAKRLPVLPASWP